MIQIFPFKDIPTCSSSQINCYRVLVTRSVRDIYETSKSTEEIERRLQGLVEYRKWKSEETRTAYQHYFDRQRDADTREAFHERMHGEIQHYLKEYKRGRRPKSVSRKPRAQETEVVERSAPHISDEPDLAFLYRLAGEV